MRQLTTENITSACEEADAFLTRSRLAPKALIRLRLSIEEVLLRYREKLGPDAVFNIEFGRRPGGARIRITVPGPSTDPFAADEGADDSDEFMRRAMLNMGKLPVWRFERGRNVVLFEPEKKRLPQWARLVIAIAAALACGLLIRLAPDAVRLTARDVVVQPLIDTFLGFLNAVAGPLIFLSVVCGICSVGDMSVFSVMGRKLAVKYLRTLTLTVLLAAALSRPFFRLNAGAAQAGGGLAGLYRMILDVVPSNLFTPFSRGNMLQILFLAIVTGVTMICIGEKSRLIASAAEELSLIVSRMMGAVGKLVPLFVFCSVFSLAAGSDFGQLANSGNFFLGTLAGCALVLAVRTAAASVRLRLSPVTLWKRALPTFLVGLSTASSVAAFDENLKCCTQTYGVSTKLANFAVPLGQILFKPGSALIFWFAALSMAEQAAVPVSPVWYVTAVLMVIVLSAATPPVPGGTAAGFSVLFLQLGIPMESLALVLAINVILDYFYTATNVFSGQCVLLETARQFSAGSPGPSADRA